MKNISKLALIILLLVSQKSFSKYFDATIYYTNGDYESTLIKMPIKSFSGKIKIKSADGAEKEKVLTSEIKFIEVFYGSDEKAFFTVGTEHKYSKKDNTYQTRYPKFDEYGVKNVGLVVGIEGDFVLSRHGMEVSYTIKNSKGKETLFTVYGSTGYTTYISEKSDTALIPVDDLRSKKRSSTLIDFLFSDSNCSDVFNDLGKKDIEKIDQILELLSTYTDCQKN
jgi:hypothetical protein